jgi:hypothetical protein
VKLHGIHSAKDSNVHGTLLTRVEQPHNAAHVSLFPGALACVDSRIRLLHGGEAEAGHYRGTPRLAMLLA